MERYYWSIHDSPIVVIFQLMYFFYEKIKKSIDGLLFEGYVIWYISFPLYYLHKRYPQIH